MHLINFYSTSILVFIYESQTCFNSIMLAKNKEMIMNYFYLNKIVVEYWSIIIY